MKKYHFISFDGNLYKLTKKAYRAWIKDSAAKNKMAKLSKYGSSIGSIIGLHSVSEFENKDFIRLNSYLNGGTNG